LFFFLFLHHPLSSMHYTNGYRKQSRKSSVFGNGHVRMGCLLHMLPPAGKKKKPRANKSSFPHKAQDKIKPRSQTEGGNECSPGSFADASRECGDSSTLSMTENSTVVQNKLLILTFILIQFAE